MSQFNITGDLEYLQHFSEKPNFRLNDSCAILLPSLSAYQKGNKDTFIPLYSDAYVGLGIFKASDHDKGKNCWLTEKSLKDHYKSK